MTGSAARTLGAPQALAERLSTAEPRYRTVDLDRWRDSVGATSSSHLDAGRMNVWRNSLPAAQLPPAGRITVDGVPFEWPTTDGVRHDNVRCAGQTVAVPPGRYDWLYVLGAAERRVEDEVGTHFDDGSVDFEPLRLSDFWAAPAVFGESPAIVTTHMHYPHHVQAGVTGTVWCQRVPIVRRATLVAVRMPDNIAVHIFALTVRASVKA